MSQRTRFWYLSQMPVPGGVGGGTLIFSYICSLGSFLGAQNFEFQHFWGFQKNVYFWGYVEFVDIFEVITKFDYINESVLCTLRSFLKVKVLNGGYFGGC